MDERGARSGLRIGRNENRDMKGDVAERAWLLQRLQQVPKATQTRICDGKEGGEADERERTMMSDFVRWRVCSSPSPAPPCLIDVHPHALRAPPLLN